MKEIRMSILSSTGTERTLGEIVSHEYEGKEIEHLEITFDGQIYGRIRLDEKRHIYMTPNKGVSYQYDDMPEFKLIQPRIGDCPNCGNKGSLGLARTVEREPSAWWIGSYHYYYKLFCPNCWFGKDYTGDFFNKGEDEEALKQRLLDDLNKR